MALTLQRWQLLLSVTLWTSSLAWVRKYFFDNIVSLLILNFILNLQIVEPPSIVKRVPFIFNFRFLLSQLFRRR